MSKISTRESYGLLIILVLAIGAVWGVRAWAFKQTPRPYSAEMEQAAERATRWFESVGEMKSSRDIVSDSHSHTCFHWMIGDDFTPMTTTLGSLEAKETAANPEFAALVYRLFVEAGLDSTSTIGVTLSGSFPSLAMATLAAVQTLGADAVMLSSLGSSTYGANQPGATWVDMEHWLREHSDLQFTSRLVTPGAENDNGEGLAEEGLLMMREAAERNGIELYHFATLTESISARTNILTHAGVDLLVNIGGNQANLGGCAHGSTVPNGYRTEYESCDHEERGVVARMTEQGIPFIHLLNIKDIASRYGLAIAPGKTITTSETLYTERRVVMAGPAAGLAAILGGLACWRRFGRKRGWRNADAEGQ